MSYVEASSARCVPLVAMAEFQPLAAACPKLTRALAKGAPTFEEDHRAVQRALKTVRELATYIKRETTALNAPAVAVPDSRRRVAQADLQGRDAARCAAKQLQVLAALLRSTPDRSWSTPCHGTPQDHILWRVIQQKLSENLAEAESTLKAARQGFDRSALEREYAQAAAATAPADPTRDQEAQDRAQLQQAQALDGPSEAAVESHTELVSEFVGEISSVHRDLIALQQSIVDVATITHEQGGVVDDIESNLGKVEESAKCAVEQLAETKTRQEKQFNHIGYLLLLAVIMGLATIGTAIWKGQQE